MAERVKMVGLRPGAEDDVSPHGDLAPKVGANLRRLRVRRGLSLERLVQRSGLKNCREIASAGCRAPRLESRGSNISM
jgi:hypothetical protein